MDGGIGGGGRGSAAGQPGFAERAERGFAFAHNDRVEELRRAIARRDFRAADGQPDVRRDGAEDVRGVLDDAHVPEVGRKAHDARMQRRDL
jgi:hypothetical protein